MSAANQNPLEGSLSAADGAGDAGDEVAHDVVVDGPPRLVASVRVTDPGWGAVTPASLVRGVLSILAASPHAQRTGAAGEMDILFTDDAEVAALNARHRQRSGTTNVLAFPSGELAPADSTSPAQVPHWGGIALALEQSEREAVERGISLSHHASHLTLHGLLHLLGFDHVWQEDREAMERIEVELLKRLGIADPY